MCLYRIHSNLSNLFLCTRLQFTFLLPWFPLRKLSPSRQHGQESHTLFLEGLSTCSCVKCKKNPSWWQNVRCQTQPTAEEAILDLFSSPGNRKSGLSLSWKEPLPTPVYEIHHQSSVDSNPYVSLESPPASPQLPGSDPNTLTRRKKLFTFSRPPRSRDTDKFLDALSEQLGHRVTLVDDFVPGENDYEEVRKSCRHQFYLCKHSTCMFLCYFKFQLVF